MNVVKSLNTAGAVATIALLAACSADPSAPVALRPASPSLDVTSTPPATPILNPQRTLIICKTTTNTSVADHFTYRVDVSVDGGAFLKTISGIDVLAGNCVDAQLGLLGIVSD